MWPEVWVSYVTPLGHPLFCRSASHSMGSNGGPPSRVAVSPVLSQGSPVSTASVTMMKLVLTEWQLWIFNSNSQ